MPYRTNISNYWSDHRCINSNQIDLIDSSTFQLIDHICIENVMVAVKGKMSCLIQLFSRSVGNGSKSRVLLGYLLIIMRTSLVVAGVKHCSVFSEIGGSGKS